TLYGLDEGDDAFTGSQEQFWQQNGLGYEASVSANVGSLMASYSAIDGNDTRMHFGGKWDIINQFKNNGIIGTNNKTFQFGGFVVSDWEAATRAAYFQQMVTGESLTLPQIYAKSINAGVDMQMVATGDTLNPRAPQSESNTLWYSTVGEVVDAFKSAYNNGLISESTLHNSVIRILMTKLSMQPQSITMNDYPNIQAKERELALKASEQSLVLLKNESSIIPINPGTITNVVFVGKTNDVGIQNGGWTINWQGQEGNQYFTGTDGISSGTVTIESAIIKKLGTSVNYYYVNDSESVNNLPITGVGGANTLVIGVVNEPPYAEYMGDIANNVESDEWYSWGIKTNTNRYMPAIQKDNLNVTYSTIHEATTIESLYNSGAKIITIIYSGRPVILQGIAGSPDAISNAEIAAFLPGTTGGQAISNAIFGNYHFRANGKSNTLPFPWPLNMQQVEDHFKNGSLYPSGYGLSS
ncbi:MAG: glycoside hydrolase family 3 C-terminal domain-containing protein, partial [Neisseriaceae bacterium]